MNMKFITKNRQERTEAPGVKAGSGPLFLRADASVLPAPFGGNAAEGSRASSTDSVWNREIALTLPSEFYLTVKRGFLVGRIDLHL